MMILGIYFSPKYPSPSKSNCRKSLSATSNLSLTFFVYALCYQSMGTWFHSSLNIWWPAFRNPPPKSYRPGRNPICFHKPRCPDESAGIIYSISCKYPSSSSPLRSCRNCRPSHSSRAASELSLWQLLDQSLPLGTFKLIITNIDFAEANHYSVLLKFENYQ